MAQVKKFFIGSRQVYLEISPQLASTLDETLDNFSVKELANDIKNPYTPLQKFYIKDENNNIIQTFIISADNVELASVNPNRYIHNLSLVQLSEFLTKHEVRNTVFSSQQDNSLIKYVSATVYAKNMADVVIGVLEEQLQYQSDAFDYLSSKVNASIDLSKKTVYSLSFKIKMSTQTIASHTGGTGRHDIYMDYTSPNKWSDLYENALYEVTNYPTIVFTIGNETREMTISSDDYSNGDIVNVPSSIINWIQTFNTGILTISIKDYDTTFMDSSAFINVNGIGNPWLVNICYIFDMQLGSIDYNIYSVLDTLLKQQMKETDDYNSTNDSDHVKPLFLLPTPSHNASLYNLLKTTGVPNFIFTQCSMYDILAEIFKLFDAIFTIDDDGYLDIEYFNDYGQVEVSEPEQAGRNASLSEERFTNKLITYFQNTKIIHKFPNSNVENSLAFLRSKTIGVPNPSDYVFIVPKAIDLVLSVKLKAPITFNSNLNIRYSGTVHYLHFGNPTDIEPLDITPFVIEDTIWSILPNGEPPIDGDWSIVGKFNSLSYKRGTNYISVSEYKDTTLQEKTTALSWVIASAIRCLMGIGSTQNENVIQITTIDWTDVKMAVEYIALVDGKLVNESIDAKYNGETLINQSNGSIDINKLGLNMEGLSLKLGQPTLNVTQLFSSWDERVKKGQYFVDANGDRWVANNCVYTIIKPDLVQTNIEFIKNFNGLAKRIELNSEKRLSNISNELTVKCEETYGEFIYYSSEDEVSPLDIEEIALKGKYLSNQILLTFGSSLNETNYTTTSLVEYALITAYDKMGNIIELVETGQVKNVAIPLMVYGSGNSVAFEMSFDSPISAGNQLLNNYTSQLWRDGWFSRAVLYTDDEGTAESFTIDFVKMEEEITRYYPEMKSDRNTFLSTFSYGKINKFKYYKKPNEIFALNYQLHFLPVNKNVDFLSNEFIKNNGFARGLNRNKLRLITSITENIYSILDTKGEGTPYEIESITNVNYYSTSLRLKVVFTASEMTSANWNNVKSWAIVDKNNNIYFASNNSPSKDLTLSSGQFAIYFISRHHRLE